MIMIDILVIIIGYLIGTISPAYFLGKIMRGVDIRKIGDCNAGATNALKEIGVMAGIVTVLFDLLKGIVAFGIAYMFHADQIFIFLAGMAAIIGHIFPFYLQFKGGQGAATSAGLLVLFLFMMVDEKSFSMEGILVLAVVVICIYIITRAVEFVTLITMPSLAIMIYNYPWSDVKIFTYVIIVYLIVLSLYTAKKKNLFKLKESTLKELLPWRTFMRPVAILIPILYAFWWSKETILWVVGGLTLPFLTLDLLRLMSKKVNFYFFDKTKVLFKSREKKRFSSLTLFFLSIFLSILLFDKNIAIVSICFLIFGDVFAKFFGLEYGKIKIFDGKSLEGSLAHFIACFLIAYILSGYVGLPFGLLAIAAIFATVIEALPIGANDNFTVPLLTAIFLKFTKKFFLS